MGKRRRDSEDEYVSDVNNSSDDYAPPKKQPAKKTRKSRVSNGKASSESRIVSTIASPHPSSMHTIQSPEPLIKALISWYQGVSTLRGMPWRKPWDSEMSKDPEFRSQRAYEVWVSEIMLQQTQVATVISYYNNWMQKFPTIADLAKASLDEVNAAWKGLGYYSRASRLLAGAQKVMKSFHGKLPSTASELQAVIPGIGRYSSGAIASIAYGERVPVLDGNVHRLLSRILGLYANPKAKGTLDVLWQAATVFVEEGTDPEAEPYHPGDINQALIELGSTVCKVKDPNCGSCPLKISCVAYSRSQGSSVSSSSGEVDIEDLCTLCEPLPEDSSVTIYPMKAEKKKAREEVDVVSVMEWRPSEDSSERHILLVKRPSKGLLAGLHEFPTSADVGSITASNMAALPAKLVATYLDAPSSIVRHIKPLGDVLHVFSHIKKTYRVQHVLLVAPTRPPLKVSKTESPNTEWVLASAVSQANIGTGVAKIWKLVESSR